MLNRSPTGLALAVVLSSAAALSAQAPAKPPSQPGAAATPTPAAARAFLEEVNREILRLGVAANRAGWVQSTFITPDTEAMNAEANEAYINRITDYAKRARRFDKTELTPIERRQLDVLKNSVTVSAPATPKEAQELTQILARMEG